MPERIQRKRVLLELANPFPRAASGTPSRRTTGCGEMTYQTEDYRKLERNHTRARQMLDLIDIACKLNRMKYADDITITAIDKDGRRIEVPARGDLKKAVLQAGAAHCVNVAEIVNESPMEIVNFEKAASI